MRGYLVFIAAAMLTLGVSAGAEGKDSGEVHELKLTQEQLQNDLKGQISALSVEAKTGQIISAQMNEIKNKARILRDLNEDAVARAKALIKERKENPENRDALNEQAAVLKAQLIKIRDDKQTNQEKFQKLDSQVRDHRVKTATLLAGIRQAREQLKEVNKRIARVEGKRKTTLAQKPRSRESREEIARMDRAIASQSAPATTYAAGTNVTLQLRSKDK